MAGSQYYKVLVKKIIQGLDRVIKIHHRAQWWSLVSHELHLRASRRPNLQLSIVSVKQFTAELAAYFACWLPNECIYIVNL